MDVIEKFLNEVSWKFDKGYPDITNEQDILLLERLLNKLNINLDLNEVTDEDSPDLPDEILKLKSIIQSIGGAENVSAVKKSGGKNYFFYARGVGDKDREARKDLAQLIVNGLPKEYIITKTDFSTSPYFSVDINGKEYNIYLKGLGKSPFDTDTDQKEGLVILMYNILKSGENLSPFNQQTLPENVNILQNSIDNSSLTEGLDGKALNSIKSFINTVADSDLSSFPSNKLKYLNNPYSIALKINNDYPGEKIIRDGVFSEIRSKSQQIYGVPADKWNPGDIYIEIKTPSNIPDTEDEINGLFVNKWGDKDHNLVSISLKESSSQPGRAKSYFKIFKDDQGNLRDQEFNLSSEELKWDEEILTQKTKEQQEKFLSKVKGKNIKLAGDGFDKLPEDVIKLRAKYGSYKLMNFLLDNHKDLNDPRKAILSLVSYGLSLSGINPTYFKLRGKNDGSEADDPTIFPAGSSTQHSQDPEIIDSSKAGGFTLKTVIDTVKGGEIVATKPYKHSFRTSGGPQIQIV